MTAQVIALAERYPHLARANTIRVGDRVRPRGQIWPEGTVMDFIGNGSASDPVRAMVQFPDYRTIKPLVELERAR